MLRREIWCVRCTYNDVRARLVVDIEQHNLISAEKSLAYRALTSPQSKLEHGVVSLRFGLPPRLEIRAYGVNCFPR